MMEDHMVSFISIIKREHEGAFILALTLCSPHVPLAQLCGWRVWLKSCPTCPQALSIGSVSSLGSSPNPSEGLSFFLWHPFSLNSHKLLMSQAALSDFYNLKDRGL